MSSGKPTSSGAEASKGDNFSAIRLVAAMTVVFGHSFPLTGGEGPAYLGSASSTLAVKVFFVISGLLISESWMRDPHPLRYLARRALRIFPALIALALITVFIVGPLLTTEKIPAYFHNGRTWAYFQNVILSPSYDLPGVFQSNVYRGAINGSLWTLPVEFAMYLMVPVVLTLPLRRYLIVVAALALSVASIWLTRVSRPGSDPVFWGTDLVSGLEMAPYFFWGAVYKIWAPRHWLNLQAGLLMLVLLPLAVTDWASAEIVSLILVPYLTLSLGYARPPVFAFVDRIGDFSYGAYLYGFLCQQIVADLWPSPGRHWTNFVLAAIPTLVLGAVSWRLIEAPALRLKPRARKAPAPAFSSAAEVRAAGA